MNSKSDLHLFAPEERTLSIMLSIQAKRSPERPFITFSGQTWTFDDAKNVAALYAGILQSAGIRKHDRVALISPNGFEFLTILLGSAWLGAVVVPINTASRGGQLQHILYNSGATILVIDPAFQTNLDHLDFSKLSIRRIWSTKNSEISSVAGISIENLPKTGQAISPGEVEPSDALAILYTSGTTGLSKGVLCPHAQYYWWAFNSRRVLQLQQDDILFTALPLFHNNALNTFYQALILGAHMVLEKRFSRSGFFTSLCESGATVTFLLGAMAPMLLSSQPMPAERQHRVRVALSPGTPARFHEEFLGRTGIKLVDGWGSTETNFVIGTTADQQIPGMIGTVNPDFEARIVDEHEKDMPDGQPGELLVRAQSSLAFASEYFNAPEKTAEAWRGGWFHTGDRVVRETNGYYRFIDRIKDSIRRRGENISSYEVEQAFLEHPNIASAVIFPVRSELGEDEVMAAVILRPGKTATAIDLIRFVEPKLPYFAVPRFVEFLDALPMTESGKVQKYKLSERGVSGATFDLESSGYKVKRS